MKKAISVDDSILLHLNFDEESSKFDLLVIFFTVFKTNPGATRLTRLKRRRVRRWKGSLRRMREMLRSLPPPMARRGGQLPGH